MTFESNWIYYILFKTVGSYDFVHIFYFTSERRTRLTLAQSVA
jgi:hypothetical protein